MNPPSTEESLRVQKQNFRFVQIDAIGVSISNVAAPFLPVFLTRLGASNLLDSLNHKEMQHLGKSRRQLFEELDQPALLPLPEHPYEFARWKNARVNIDYHVV